MASSHPYKVGESSTSETFPTAPEEGAPAKLVLNRNHVKASKRIRGEIACAECRRLKIRCDKVVPCSTCVKRGCGTLCPNGTLPPGEGSRFVLAATEHLEATAQKLEARMHSLEDALAIAYVSQSKGTHALLVPCKDDESCRDSSPAVGRTADSGEPSPTSRANSSATGLYISDDGKSRFFGPTGSESMMHEQAVQPPHSTDLDTSYLPEEITMCCRAFPFTAQKLSVESIKSSILTFLPQLQRAYDLVDTFLEHLSWMMHIVSKQQMRDLIDIVYNQKDVEYGPHDLALLSIVLSVGAMVDLHLPAYNTEAQHYYKLAQAALAMQPILVQESFASVKVLHLMSVYNGLSGKEENLEVSYAYLSLASQVALRIGCHIDPMMWGFTGKEAYDRRVYFWNLVAGSLWQSLVTGRPPIFFSTYIDCKIPTPEDEDLFQHGEVPLGFGIWGFRFSSQLLFKVVEVTLSAEPPTYDTVLDLDKRIREFASSQPAKATTGEDTTALSMRNFVRSHYKELILMFLHRGCFTQAMTEYPTSPLTCPYGKSVVTAYQTACVLLEDTYLQYHKKPMLCARIWRIWSLAFNAAVIVGTIATRGAHLNLQPPALDQLETIYAVFKDAAQVSSRALRALPILEPMLQNARAAQRELQKSGVTPCAPPLPSLRDVLNPGQELHLQPSQVRQPSIILPTTIPIPAVPSHSHQRYRPAGLEARQVADTQPSSSVGVREAPFRHDRRFPTAVQYEPPTTFADLSQGWDGLFRETPTPQLTLYGFNAPEQRPVSEMGSQMMDDRWLHFMKNYGILSDYPMPSS